MGKVTKLSLLLVMALTAKVSANMGPVIGNDPVIMIREDIPIGSVAFTINAEDPEGDTVTYGIRGPGAIYFSVDATTGVVTVQFSLDREDPSFDGILPLTLTASDAYTLTEHLCTIVLHDANDNAPRFYGTPYYTEIEENAALDTNVFTVQATDPDSGFAGVVTYSIVAAKPSEGTSLFDIHPRTGIIMVKGSLSLADKCCAFYKLTILASDGGGPLGDDPNFVQSSTTYAFLNVVEVGALDPQFTNSSP